MGAVTFSIDVRLVELLKKALPLSVFFETGTFKGDAVEAMRPYAERIISVESSEALWKESAARFAEAPGIEILHGDSAQVLALRTPALAGASVLYWLDAHWCVATNAAGDHGQCPLLGEIAAIGRLGEQSMVLIDDARLFLAPPPEPHDITHWPTFEQVETALRRLSDRHELMVVNDVIAFYPRAARAAVSDYARKHGVDWLRAAQALAENPGYRAALMEKEEELRHLRAQEKEEQIREKQEVIDELRTALAAYRGAFILLSPLLVPLNFLGSKLARALRFFKPRLGVLNQHAPRPLSFPRDDPPAATPANAPRITIVTPSFNQAEFIDRTIRSVLDQGYPALEYIVQDGNSSDGTIDILRRHEARLAGWDSRPDEGQSQAINRGFAGTTGEIMAWLNSDDVLFPGALAYVARYFTEHPDVDVIYGHRILIDAGDRQIGRWILPAHSDRVLSWADFIPQETLFWRRRIWDKAGGRVDESFRFAMDWDLLLRFREAGARFERVPRFLGGFRIHGRQKTSASISDVGFLEMDRLRERVLGHVPSRREVRNALLPYLLRHVAVDLRWKLRDTFSATAAEA